MKTKNEIIESIVKRVIDFNPYFNRTKLADSIGISRQTIYRAIDELNKTKQLS